MEKSHCTKLERWLNKCKLELEATEQRDIPQPQLEDDMLQRKFKNIYSEKGSLEFQLDEFKDVIQQLMSNQVHGTLARNAAVRAIPRFPTGMPFEWSTFYA